MALVTKNRIQELSFSLDGSPWCKVTAKDSINVNDLSYSLDGSPWWGHGESGYVPPSGFKIYVGALQVMKIYMGETEIPVANIGNIQL